MSDDTDVELPLRPANGCRPAESGAGPLIVNASAGVQKNHIQSGGGYQLHRASEDSTALDGNVLVRIAVARRQLCRATSAAGAGGSAAARCVCCQSRSYQHTTSVGLGGAGESQLGQNYIQTHREDYAAVFWVDARLRESVERDYIQIYCLLFGSEQDSASLERDVGRVVTAVKAWFHGRYGRWRFVLDNADSLDKSDPYFVDLQHYLPYARGVEIQPFCTAMRNLNRGESGVI
ncbi:hypothetical protein LTS10_013250 [Elasticomyces elasticus]|nr:hypothetical protein LTS10_013250 [Elasticomyces elasticus]